MADGAAWVQTYTGRKFYPLAPVAADIDPRDIAHSLANQCRFTGHTSRFYSVAEHSVHVSHNCDPADALWGLLHDATEAYLTDFARPLKHDPEFGPVYLRFEGQLHAAVAERFGLPAEIPASVHRADNDVLLTEKRDLLGPSPDLWYVGAGEAIGTLDLTMSCSPEQAKQLFRLRYFELTGEVIS